VWVVVERSEPSMRHTHLAPDVQAGTVHVECLLDGQATRAENTYDLTAAHFDPWRRAGSDAPEPDCLRGQCVCWFGEHRDLAYWLGDDGLERRAGGHTGEVRPPATGRVGVHGGPAPLAMCA
jgi:hypothetical protein